jgi:hypothetical protein
MARKLPPFLDFAFLLKALPPQEPPDAQPVVLEQEDFRLSLLAPAAPGMPFRPLGYLLLTYIGSEAIRRKARVIGSSLPKLCRSLGAPELADNPGVVEDQLLRLAHTSVKLEVARKKTTRTFNFPFFSQLILDFHEPGAGAKWQVRVSGDFYQILRHTAPAAIRKKGEEKHQEAVALARASGPAEGRAGAGRPDFCALGEPFSAV